MGIGFCIKGSRFEVEAQWSYSGFNRFRHRLAAAVGINLDQMVGYGGRTSWKKVKDEPLVPFLYHSDCEGQLSPTKCALVAPRLRKLLRRPEFVEEIYPRDRMMGIDLAKGMEEAARLQKPLIFC